MLSAGKCEELGSEPTSGAAEAQAFDPGCHDRIPGRLREPAKSLYILFGYRADEDVTFLDLRTHAQDFAYARFNRSPRAFSELCDLLNFLAVESVREDGLSNYALVSDIPNSR